MYISSVKVSNVLRFRDGAEADLSFARPNGKFEGWTVLAGRNGSGKTSLLQCIALALVGPEVAPRIAPLYAAWGHGSERSEVAVSLFLDRYEVKDLLERFGESAAPGPGTHMSIGLSFQPIETTPEGDHRVRISRTVEWNARLRIGNGTSDERRSVEDWFVPTRNSFSAGYGPFRRLALNSQPRLADSVENDPEDILKTSDRFVTLFRDSASLDAAIPWLIGLHLRSLEGDKSAQRMLDTVIGLLSDGLLPDDYQIIRVNSSGLWVRRGGKTFSLRNMSDGHRTVTALVLDIVRGIYGFYRQPTVRRVEGILQVRSPGIVLIDEIDAHMHVSWQRRIGGWLKEHFPRLQFIVTTHSPYICQAADPGGLIRLPGPGESGSPNQVDDSLYQRIVYGSGDDAAMSELFGIESPYSERAEEIRRELVELESRVFSGEATKSETARYRELSQLLASSSSARIEEVAARLRTDK